MKRRTLLTLIVLLALLSVSCNLVSRFAGKAKETAKAAVETAQSVAQEATATPAPQSANPQTATPQAESSQPMAGDQQVTTPETPSEPTATPTPGAGSGAKGGAEKLSAPEGEAGPVEVDDLDNLHSYRGEWATKVQLGKESGMGLRYRIEWTKEPSAQHVWVDMGMAPFAEAIWIEDEVWVKQGEQWIKAENEDAKQAFEDFHSAFDVDKEMILVGEDTVNRVRCKRYVDDFVGPNQTPQMHREVWVANQGDLPKVPIRAIFRMENNSGQDTMITEIEANLTDINTSIEIRPPK